MENLVFYAYKSRDGHTYCIQERLNSSLMTGDYLLFDSAEDCVTYWRELGVIIDRYA